MTPANSDEVPADEVPVTGDTAPGGGEFPLRSFLGMELTGDESGVGYAHVDITGQHHNPNGVVHGAVLFALVDTAMGKATMSTVEEPGRYCASVEVSLRFLRPVVAGRLTAEARVTKRGRHLAHLDASVRDDEGRVVATAAGTFAFLGG